MSWYRESWASCSWGSSAPGTAREVAAAFYDGRPRKRKNCWTDGANYFLFGNIIARRIKDDQLHMFAAERLKGESQRRLLEFTWAGWPTRTTARHLCALGLHARVEGLKYPRALFDGKYVDPDKIKEWFTLEEIAHMESWVDPEIAEAEERRVARAARRVTREHTSFVQLTGDLFDASDPPQEEP